MITWFQFSYLSFKVILGERLVLYIFAVFAMLKVSYMGLESTIKDGSSEIVQVPTDKLHLSKRKAINIFR